MFLNERFKALEGEIKRLNAELAGANNKLELAEEDIEAYHMAMDALKVPRADERGAVFSAYGRALQLRKAERERCIERCKVARDSNDMGCEWNLALEHVVDVLSAIKDE